MMIISASLIFLLSYCISVRAEAIAESTEVSSPTTESDSESESEASSISNYQFAFVREVIDHKTLTVQYSGSIDSADEKSSNDTVNNTVVKQRVPRNVSIGHLHVKAEKEKKAEGILKTYFNHSGVILLREAPEGVQQKVEDKSLRIVDVWNFKGWHIASKLAADYSTVFEVKDDYENFPYVPKGKHILGAAAEIRRQEQYAELARQLKTELGGKEEDKQNLEAAMGLVDVLSGKKEKLSNQQKKKNASWKQWKSRGKIQKKSEEQVKYDIDAEIAFVYFAALSGVFLVVFMARKNKKIWKLKPSKSYIEKENKRL